MSAAPGQRLWTAALSVWDWIVQAVRSPALGPAATMHLSGRVAAIGAIAVADVTATNAGACWTEREGLARDDAASEETEADLHLLSGSTPPAFASASLWQRSCP